MKIVLASSSPRRKKLLEQINLSFEICASDIEEIVNEKLPPHQIVMDLATQKGENVAETKPKSLVIAADTIVCFGNKILGKPVNKPDAFAMLKQLSGKSHAVFTGVYTGLTDEQGVVNSFAIFEKTIVTFGTLSDQDIKRYIATDAPYDKAGSYGIQDDLGCLFVERIEGDYYNVVGFPLFKFYQTLTSVFPEVTKHIFENSINEHH